MAAQNGTPAGKDRSAIFTRDFVLVSFINFTVFFGFQMTNVGIPVYMAQLGADAFVVGIATTLMTTAALIFRPFIGAVTDRLGRKGVLIGGMAIVVCATVSYAIFPIVGVILGLRVLHGVGWGLSSTATSTIAADIIPKKRFAEGMGYFALTNSISSALAPALAIYLTQGVGALEMLVVASASVGISFVLSLFQRNTVQKADGELPRAAAAAQSGERGAAVASDKPAGPPAGAREQQGSKLDAIFERRALLPSVAMLLTNIGFATITTFIALHGAERGVENMSLYFVFYALTTIATRPSIGKLIDRYGFFVPGILAGVGTAGSLALIGLSVNIWMFCAAGVLAGLGLGTGMGVYQTMAVSVVEPWRRGVATSTYFFAFDAGIAAGAVIGGALAQVFGYGMMFVLMGIAPLLSVALFLVAGREKIAAFSAAQHR